MLLIIVVQIRTKASCFLIGSLLPVSICSLSSFIGCAPRNIFAPSATELGNNSNVGAQPQLASLSTFYPNPSAPPAIEVTAPSPNVEKKYARVLYDYAAADLTEISLTADEVYYKP